MHRLACAFVVVAAACGGGTGTGSAMLTGSPAPVKSVFCKPFTGADASGTQRLAWKIDFVEQGPGASCTDSSLKIPASVAVFTSQTPSATAKVANLNDSDEFVITTDVPPTVSGTGAANMAVTGISAISGNVTFTAVDKNPDGSIFEVDGTVQAAGTDANGNNVTLSGTFMAPVCKS